MTEATRNLLEQHFDTAFAAPDGIVKLRELILTLAMRGKLVKQDANDPPASELLKQIETERRRLVKAGEIKPPKPLPPINPEEVPYALPQGWEWVRLIEIGSWALGSGLPHSIQGETEQEILLCKVSDMNLPGNEKFIVSANNTVSKETTQQSKLNISEPGTIIFPKIGGAIATNKRRILQKKTVIDNNCLGITPSTAMNLEWCYQLLLSFDFAKYQSGTSVPAISQGIIGGIVIGLPPASEQHRIVARIGQLMARCDELEKLREKRGEKRLAVHAAAIKQLLDTTPSPAQPLSSPPRRRGSSHPDPLDSRLRGNDGENSGNAWDFIQQHFGELYTVKENVTELRKTILQLAVTGRLVPQDPSDPPASELLKQIETEKRRLVKAGKIKQPKPLPPIKPEEVPYALPQSWEWVRLGDIGIWRSGSTPSRSNANFYGGNIPWVKSGEVKQGRIIVTEETITQAALDKCSLHINDKGSVLVAMYGANIGEVGILEIEAATNQAVCACRTYTNFDENYLLYLITSLKPYFLSQGAGAAQPNISREKIVATIFPLPPLPEQHRIVARIDQLMALCDMLDKQIDAATGKQAELLNAVMAQV